MSCECARKSDVALGSVKAFAVGSNTLAVYNIDGTLLCHR